MKKVFELISNLSFVILLLIFYLIFIPISNVLAMGFSFFWQYYVLQIFLAGWILNRKSIKQRGDLRERYERVTWEKRIFFHGMTNRSIPQKNLLFQRILSISAVGAFALVIVPGISYHILIGVVYTVMNITLFFKWIF